MFTGMTPTVTFEMDLRTGAIQLSQVRAALLTHPFMLVRDRFWLACWAGPYEVSYTAGASLWGRWFVVGLCVFIIVQRPYPFPMSQYVSYGMVIGLLIVVNGLIHLRLRSNRPLTWRWMLALNATDMALVTAAVWISGGFASLFSYLLYYPALAMFAVLFTSLKLNLVWGTSVALTYSMVSLTVAEGIDLDAA